MLRALDVRVRASRDEFHVEGSLRGINSVQFEGRDMGAQDSAEAAG